MTDKLVKEYPAGFHGPKCLGGTEPHPECNTDRTSWFDAAQLGKTENYAVGPADSLHATDEGHALSDEALRNYTGKANEERGMRDITVRRNCISGPEPIPPGLKNDIGKPSWTLLPFRALSLVVDVLTFGAKEYARDNWQQVKPEYRYEDALFRHYAAWRLGERLDPKSGLPHLAHLACNALFILALKEGTDP